MSILDLLTTMRFAAQAIHGDYSHHSRHKDDREDFASSIRQITLVMAAPENIRGCDSGQNMTIAVLICAQRGLANTATYDQRM